MRGRRRALWAATCGLLFTFSVPLWSADLRDRIGFYQWVGPPVGSGEPDSLTAARERATALGAKVFRLYVGARFDYVHRLLSSRRFQQDRVEGPLTPAKIIALARYRAVLEDPKIETVVLTVYPIADYGAGPDDMNLSRPWGPTEREIEFSQTTELCEFLYREFGQIDKTVILANTEADNKLLDIMNYTGSPDLAVENLRAWTQTRFEAVEQVRLANRGARLRIFHAFEISLVNLRIAKQGSAYDRVAQMRKGGRGWNALNDIVPHVSFDLLSYSAYESSNSPYETQRIDVDAGLTRQRLERDLQLIRRRAAASVSSVGRRRFGRNFVMIGEVGYPRERFEILPTGGVLPRLRGVLEAAAAENCPYVVLWQVFDNPRSGAEAWGFGMVDRLGRVPRLRAEQGCDSIKSCIGKVLASGLGAWSAREGLSPK